MTEYNPNGSSMSTNSLVDFLRNPITGDIQEVPGISKNNAQILSYGDNEYTQIKNTFQLIGVCLTLKHTKDGELINCKDHCNLIKKYLTNKGIKSNKDTITLALVEKLNTMFPGLYNYDY